MLVFAALGLGLALPFVLVAFVPALRNRLPKPGPWMRTLQRFLAIPMAASAVAALWLLYRQGGTPALLLGLFAARSACACCCSGPASVQRDGGRGVFVGAARCARRLLRSCSRRSGDAADRDSRRRRRRGLERGRGRAATCQQGHPVFVYFTADWCLTCKVNEAAAIDRDEVRDAFRKAGVKVLAGDWTNGDPAITRFLESRGRAGVPLYLWYAPGQAARGAAAGPHAGDAHFPRSVALQR